MRSSTASVTWTPQNGIPIHPIFNSVNNGIIIEIVVGLGCESASYNWISRIGKVL